MRMKDTICALSTAQGMAAIAVIRLSGPDSFKVLNKVFRQNYPKKVQEFTGYQVLFGKIEDNKKSIDEVLVNVFKNPRSYTGEDTVEISCHGSVYIQDQIIKLLIKNGARLAEPGEFTMRAFANGKLDLSQAEAVADLISSESEASHRIAMHQMRGGFSDELKDLRQQLINFASLIELELDFAEEDVEFADRKQLNELLDRISSVLLRLIESFDTGNVIKNGIPISIVGAPNAGKSTLLNAILNEEKAIVSTVEGTTRDAIEDEIKIDGISYRFIDTAGIRETEDIVESIGIKRTYEKIALSRIVLYLFDSSETSLNIKGRKELINKELKELKLKLDDQKLLVVANKSDVLNGENLDFLNDESNHLISISALNKDGLDELINRLKAEVNLDSLNSNQTIVSNIRHYDALSNAFKSITEVRSGLENGISGDFMAIDIRETLEHLGSITGEISTDDLLGNIFSKFCIGK